MSANLAGIKPDFDLTPYLSAEVKRGNAASEATRVLREAILDSVIPPGSWLREETVSELINVSRTPIREALSRLVEEGLVERRGGSGAQVTALTVEDMAIVYSIRGSLEALSARRIVEHASDADIRAIRTIHQQMESAAELDDIAMFNRLNLKFHHALGVSAGNAYLSRLLGTVEVAMRRFGTRSYNPTRVAEVLEEHQRILKALEARDGDLAAREAESHATQAKASTVGKLLGHS